MKPLKATSQSRSAAAAVAVSAAVSGCYYYAPYGSVPYGETLTAAMPQYPFTMSGVAAADTPPDATASTNTYVAPAAPVFVAPAYYPVAYPAYYPVAYPYHGWPAWWGPSVSLRFGYWSGCCYGGGRHGYWGHGHRGWGGHGHGGHGYRGGGGPHWGRRGTQRRGSWVQALSLTRLSHHRLKRLPAGYATAGPRCHPAVRRAMTCVKCTIPIRLLGLICLSREVKASPFNNTY